MAHHEEPMDVDMDSEFDNKENTYRHTNVLPCTEKGYEELDVSELNMKLRYSITPAASPMSKSYTAYVDNRNLDDDSLNCTNENANLSRSLNSTMTKNDSVIKSLKAMPLQTISKEHIVDSKGSVLRQLDSTITVDNNVTVTISEANENENISLPSSSSSVAHTPEATTPTNITKNEEGSPIIRGLKSVFNMFRSSQSPIPPMDNDTSVKEEVKDLDETYCEDQKPTLASTPISAHRSRDGSSKRSSPLKESIVFNDDLEKELQWREDTILFSEEKIPIHKLFLTHKPAVEKDHSVQVDKLDTTVEYMDVSQNISVMEHTLTEGHVDSDGEFVDCETTFSKSESAVNKEETPKASLEATKVIEAEVKDSLEKPESLKEQDDKPINDTTKEILCEEQSTVNIVECREDQNLPSNDSIVLNVTKDAEITDSLDNESVQIKENNDIEINKELLANIPDTIDVTMEIKDEEIPLVNETRLLESDVLDVLDDQPITEDSHLIETNEIISNLNVDDTQLPLPNVDDKSLHNDDIKKITSNENLSVSNMSQAEITFIVKDEIQLEKDMNITQFIENEETICREVEEPQSPCLPATDVQEKLGNIDLSLNCNIESQIVVDNDSIQQNLPPSLPENITINDNTTPVLETYTENNNQTQITMGFEITATEATVVDAPCNVLAEDPVNIPLPDNDDFDLDLEPKVATIQDMPSSDVNSEKSEPKLDNTQVLDKLIDDLKVIENIEKGVLPISEVQNNLNETRDIVNCLTEIIGESQNNTIIQAEDLLEESLNFAMEGVECADETHVLPDLVNQTIHNMSVDCEIPPEAIIQTQYEPSVETKSETDANVNEESNSNLETFDTSVAKMNTVQSNESINANKEHIDSIVASESNEVAPNINLVDSKNNEDENEVDKKILEVDVIPNAEVNDGPNVEEELVLSENNSPYVSVIAETEQKVADESFEKIDIPLNTSNDAPSSPPIRSRGYNFNFDEMDDPFATKTKIRQSPPPTPNKQIEPDSEDTFKPVATKKGAPNRRRSQPPERKRPVLNKKKLNTTLDAASVSNSLNKIQNDQNSGDTKNDCEKNKDDSEVDKEVATILDSTQLLDKMVEENIDVTENVHPCGELLEEKVTTSTEITTDLGTENKSSVDSISTAISEVKTSSSEQSTYYSAAASSSDSSTSKNVFNLPEIEDKNFNPFATKSKMRQSPSLDVSLENPFATRSKMRSSPDSSMFVSKNTDNTEIFTKHDVRNVTEDKIDTELMEKDTSYNVSNTTSSSKDNDDKNITTREVNTEDEDTEEGPFLEAEDAIDKLLDIDNEDMMQFNEIPAQAVDENADGGELFIDAEAFEFLLNQNKSNVVADSGKESLFLKFDPLFAKRISSDGMLAALNKVQKRQSTPTKQTRPLLRNEASPIAGPSTLNATYEEETNATQESIEDLNVTVAKPMMVVTPAVNPAVTPRNKTTTPPRSNRRSITFTSPAMAVIDRLLSLSGNNSLLGQDTTITHSNREHMEADLALTQLRELLAEKEISVYQLRSESKELKDRLSTMETQVKILEADGKERLDKINELNARLADKTKINKSMAAVVEEYERTIASLIAETEQDKKRHAEERIRLINERDEQTAHLASMEVSFSDLHSKYEKSKQVILSCKANEEACKKSIKEFEENLTKMQTNYEMLKQHATSKLNHANQELLKINKAHESEVLKLNAMIKRKEMHITSLEETLAQKTKANEELTAICDELINKVG